VSVQGTAFGLLVPASNRVMEEDFRRWLPAGARMNVNRLNAPRERPDDMLLNLEAIVSGVDEVARLLGLAAPDVVAFGCTSGSFLHGAGWDEEMRARVAGACACKGVVVTARAVVDALRALGATRIAVATPYPESVNARLRAYLLHFGFDLVAFEAMDGWKGGTIARLAPQVAIDLACSVARSRPDAIVVSCTNFRAGEVVAEIEAQTGLPVVTANQATFWASARLAGIESTLAPLGRLGAH
jgi:maleate cis-trans isomerase